MESLVTANPRAAATHGTAPAGIGRTIEAILG